MVEPCFRYRPLAGRRRRGQLLPKLPAETGRLRHSPTEEKRFRGTQPQGWIAPDAGSGADRRPTRREIVDAAALLLAPASSRPKLGRGPRFPVPSDANARRYRG